LDAVLLKALEKEAEKRFPSAGAFSYAYTEAVTEFSHVNIILSTKPVKQAVDESVLVSEEPEALELDTDSKVFSSQGFAMQAELTHSRWM
jgi:hypothetical protein